MALPLFVQGIACDPKGVTVPEQLFAVNMNTQEGIKSLQMFVRYGNGDMPLPDFFVDSLNNFGAKYSKPQAFEQLLQNITHRGGVDEGFKRTHGKLAMMFEIINPTQQAIFQQPQIVTAQMLEQHWIGEKTAQQSERLRMLKMTADSVFGQNRILGLSTALQKTTQLFQEKLFDDASLCHMPLLATHGQGRVCIVGGDDAPNLGYAAFSAPFRKPMAAINLTLLNIHQQFGSLTKAGITPELMQPVADFLNANPSLKKLRV